jgi:dihydrofolate reductase
MLGIIACTPAYGVGKDGMLPWVGLGDLPLFKALTMGRTVIMGANTWKSIGSTPLLGRKNVVIGSKKVNTTGVKTFANLAELTNLLRARGQDTSDSFILIGGAKLFNSAMEATNMDLTKILLFRTLNNFTADTFLDSETLLKKYSLVYTVPADAYGKFTIETWIHNDWPLA